MTAMLIPLVSRGKITTKAMPCQFNSRDRFIMKARFIRFSRRKEINMKAMHLLNLPIVMEFLEVAIRFVAILQSNFQSELNLKS